MLNLIRSVDFQISLPETDLLSSISRPTNGIGNLKSPVSGVLSSRFQSVSAAKIKQKPKPHHENEK